MHRKENRKWKEKSEGTQTKIYIYTQYFPEK